MTQPELQDGFQPMDKDPACSFVYTVATPLLMLLLTLS